MDAECRLLDDPVELVNARPARVVQLQRATGHESTIMNCEDYPPENVDVFFVEWTVKKDIPLVRHGIGVEGYLRLTELALVAPLPFVDPSLLLLCVWPKASLAIVFDEWLVL